ncbi:MULTISPECIES: dicarboxylate/amino acid:cation symporter [unclassified Wenzhouxiangella]|uniref:dicarboxylate/amino acid:cation symporter n=1 Tax=unclassified Wenzhouxiangella TaxID=2613841 RepID=UPI000E329C37|nr:MULTISPECIES: dicarboxylate/amino acid:cation symporter [unclassified Wenzhouxiangella]RFF26936.1 dicarboxylate/amino acid:cation symporter [Wenzhouxiangella sp. 15181]RFP69449.1 dicarboxylate/amino acid:cation symporter [Wenzhouxiangella sp. 15190]
MTQEYRFDHHKLSTQILLALVLGLITGLVINLFLGEVGWIQKWLVDGLFEVVGEMFVRFLSMLIVPIVFVSLISGVASLADPKSLGRVSSKAIGLYLITTCIAIVLALLAGMVFQTGVGASPVGMETPEISEAPSFAQVLIDLVPSNPVEAMAEGNMLPIIIFSILLGLAMSFAGESGRRIGEFFTDFMEVVMKLVGIVMLIAPYGVFALIAGMAATTGWGTFAGVLKYVFLVMGMLIVHAAVVYPLLLKTFTGLSPITFYRQFRDVMAFAFSTASSGATIPVTLRAVQERLGASNRISSFTVPLGATINMDGTAIMQGIAVGFIAQYYGVDLSLTQYLMVIFMVVMASIGAAGVPGVGLILLAGVLGQVGLPTEGIALILGVDRLLDMTRTAVNVTGDATVTCIVANSEGELDRDRFNSLEIQPSVTEPGEQKT